MSGRTDCYVSKIAADCRPLAKLRRNYPTEFAIELQFGSDADLSPDSANA
ncbi:hypothetical protein Acr_15g0000840 [Actinidia rufa]|uniref:Uncharacterized protein n=1 Tax=Actinidia rufa TaxID=165716 RepID=A0A7J0FS21_9ERIC|nr:hypothetical protein Acr_15g0000840 [Actinidia rufa]